MEIYLIHGIFGELENCNGVGEFLLEPEAGGTFLKVVGCVYLYKGNPAESKVFQLEQAKSNLSTLPREIIAKSWLYSLAAGLRFMLWRKQTIHDLNIFLEEIMHKTLRHVSKPTIRVNSPQKEIVRAMEVALREEFNIDPDVKFPTWEVPSMALTPGDVAGQPIELAAVVMKFTLFIGEMMEWDCAYRFPLQDMFGELDQEAASQDPVKEFRRIFRIATERGVRLGNRFTFIEKLLPLFFWFNPQMKSILKNFLLELNLEKVVLDEADYYFCLRRNTYNFKGKTLEERMAELAVIDAEKGNQYVKFEYRHVPPKAPVPA